MQAYETISQIVELIKKGQEQKEKMSQDNTKMTRLIAQVDKSFLKKKHAINHFTYMLSAFEKDFYQKAVNHSVKVMSLVKPVANDMPFEIRDKVQIIRHEHGWHDGRMEAIIRHRYQDEKGIWKYQAQVVRFYDEEYFDPNYLVEIKHTRDAHLAN